MGTKLEKLNKIWILRKLLRTYTELEQTNHKFSDTVEN